MKKIFGQIITQDSYIQKTLLTIKKVNNTQKIA